MLSFDEAISLLETQIGPLGGETVPLREAGGRVLAAPLWARLDAPRTDVSAMDGYAVREVDLPDPGRRLRVIGEAFAGQLTPGAVGQGEAVRIFTGAPMPPGADRVIVQENVERDGDFVAIVREFGERRHVRRRGSDFASGDILLQVGELLTPRAMVAAAAADVAEVAVARLPQVTIISTGDELSEPGTANTREGKIPESVGFGVEALVRQWGGAVAGRFRCGDNLVALQSLAADALVSSDLVVVTGGASVGEKDFAKAMFKPQGLEPIFAKVAIKPGKPVWFGRAQGRLVLGLPGYPTSAMVTARLFLVPLLSSLLGQRQPSALAWRKLPLMVPLEKTGDRETFMRAQWRAEGLYPVEDRDSGAQRALIDGDWLIRCLPGQKRLAAHDPVMALAF